MPIPSHGKIRAGALATLHVIQKAEEKRMRDEQPPTAHMEYRRLF
jgi:hypothetical protein